MSLREEIWKAQDHHHMHDPLPPEAIELSVESWHTLLRETGFPEDTPRQDGKLMGMPIRVVEGLPWDFAILAERPC